MRDPHAYTRIFLVYVAALFIAAIFLAVAGSLLPGGRSRGERGPPVRTREPRNVHPLRASRLTRPAHRRMVPGGRDAVLRHRKT